MTVEWTFSMSSLRNKYIRYIPTKAQLNFLSVRDISPYVNKLNISGHLLDIISIKHSVSNAQTGALLFIRRTKWIKEFHLPVDKYFPSTFCR